MRYWTKISKNEKGGYSDMSQGNPKDFIYIYIYTRVISKVLHTALAWPVG